MDIYHQMMKEWYWFVIWGALIAIAFAPTFLKAKCVKCKKRKLEMVDLDQALRETLETRECKPYLTFFRCNACHARFLRERTSPYEDASDARWDLAFDRAYTTIAS